MRKVFILLAIAAIAIVGSAVATHYSAQSAPVAAEPAGN